MRPSMVYPGSALLLVAVGGTAVVVTDVWPVPSRLGTKPTLLAKGMTRAEADATLGCPSGDYRTADVGYQFRLAGGRINPVTGRRDGVHRNQFYSTHWLDDDQFVVVWFESGTGRLDHVETLPRVTPPPTTIDRLWFHAKRPFQPRRG